MKTQLILTAVAAATAMLVSCDARVEVPKEEKTTIVNPPAEKKVEHNTTIVPPYDWSDVRAMHLEFYALAAARMAATAG